MPRTDDSRFQLALETVVQDIRFSLRLLRKSPWFAAAAIAALALAIAANATIFSVVNSVLLRPLPYADSDRLTVVLKDGRGPIAPANFLDYKAQSKSFSAMEAAELWSPTVTGMSEAEKLSALRVTAGMFSMLGVAPTTGRTFAAGEDQAGNEHVAVLSYDLWQRRFGGDADAVGKTITLNSEPYTVVGVMPRGFKFAPFWATKSEIWVPLAFGAKASSREAETLRIFARLRDGASLEQARAEVAAISSQLERAYPGTNANVTVTALKEKVVGQVRSSLVMLLGAVAFLLLIACANIAHMLMARLAGRQREIAVRTALGASPKRILRQFVTESFVLSFVGGAVGLALTFGGVRLLRVMAPATLPRLESVNVDILVVLFTLLATVVTALIFGIAPALQTSIGALTESLKQGGHGTTAGARSNRMRTVLTTSEFALAVMLLIGAGLMIRSFMALNEIDPGFNPHRVVSMVVSLAGSQHGAAGQRAGFYREALERVQALPGVASAGAINHVPLVGDVWGTHFYVDGRPMPRQDEVPRAVYRVVMPGYFQTMQLPFIGGRDVEEGDTLSTPAVVVVNERLAKTYWPGEDAVGKRITFDDPAKGAQWATVVGVVKDARQGEWSADPEPEVYLPLAQDKSYLTGAGAHLAYFTLVVRASGDPAALVKSIASEIHAIDANVPVSEVITLDDAVAKANSQPRFYVVLLGTFAAVALLLAAIGIYAVISFAVSQRTREIAVRMALGARRADVLRMVLRRGMVLAVGGAAAGLAGAFVLSRFLSGVLYGVRPTDPVTFVAMPLVLMIVAMAANYLPARRATRIDPMVALRDQ